MKQNMKKKGKIKDEKGKKNKWFNIFRRNINLAGQNIRINEISQSEIELAFVDFSPEEKFKKRLQVFKCSKCQTGNLKLSKKSVMLTEPPICPFAPDWRFVDGELAFLSNSRIPTISRNLPNWKSTSEAILTKLDFLEINYESGIICRKRQEQAFGQFKRLVNYNSEDWARDDWSKEPWGEFSRQFLSRFYLKRGKFLKPENSTNTGFANNWFWLVEFVPKFLSIIYNFLTKYLILVKNAFYLKIILQLLQSNNWFWLVDTKMLW